MKGSEFAESVKKLSPEARESAILLAFAKGYYPSWVDNKAFWRTVNVTATIKGTDYTLAFECSPDYFSIGDNTDFIRMPARPATYQAIASKLGAILPSRQLVKYIQSAAKYKCTPKPQTPDMSMITVPVFVKYNDIVEKQLETLGGKPDSGLVSGDKKDVVVGPDLTGERVAIFGWIYPDGKIIQPYSTIHTVDHVDYSHGGRFVSRKCAVNGKVYNMEDLFKDPLLNPLVSDQGVFVPYFPNAAPPPYKKIIDFDNPDLPREFGEIRFEDTREFPMVGSAIAALAAWLSFK